MRIVSLIVCLLYCKLAMFLLLFARGYEKKINDCDCGNSDVRFCNIRKSALYLGMGNVGTVLWYSVCPMPMRLSRKVIEGATMRSSGLAAVIWVPALLYASTAAVGDLGAPLDLTS